MEKFEKFGRLAIISIEDATPMGYMNVYEHGDIWIKIQGCEKCSVERRRRCCGQCPFLTDNGLCSWQLESKPSKKPFKCVVKPFPDSCIKGCALAFECVKGKNNGKVRNVNDRVMK